MNKKESDTMNVVSLDVYCPKCKRWADTMHGGQRSLCPGEIQYECPHCKTTWRIKVEFYEVEKP